MLQLILSLIALFVGILAYPLIRRYTALLSFFDAFVLVSIIGLCFLHLIPHSIAATGLPGLLAVSVGLGLPLMMHRLKGKEHSDCEEGLCEHDHKKPRYTKQWLLALAVVGVLAHTLLDGVGLSMFSFDADEANVGALLGLGVLFHRLPVGIFLAMLLMPKYGWRVTVAIASLMGLATVVGFGLGITAQGGLDLWILYIIQALISGTLLHAVFHDISVEGRKPITSLFAVPQALGVIVAVGALVVVENFTHGGHSHAGEILSHFAPIISVAGALWLLLSIVLIVMALTLSEKRRDKCFDFLLAQNSPAINDKGYKFLSLAPLLLLFSAFQWHWAAFALAGLAATQIYAHHMVSSIPYCRDCRATLASNRCARHREVVLEQGVVANPIIKGLASLFRAREIVALWTKIFLFAAVLALLPMILGPVRELVETLSTHSAFYPALLLLVFLAVAAVFWRGSQMGPLLRLMVMVLVFFILPSTTPGLIKVSLWLTFVYVAFVFDYASYRELRDEVAQHQALNRLRALHIGVLGIILGLGSLAMLAQSQCQNLTEPQIFANADFIELKHAHGHDGQQGNEARQEYDSHGVEPQSTHQGHDGHQVNADDGHAHDRHAIEEHDNYGIDVKHDTLSTECAHAHGPEMDSDHRHEVDEAVERLILIVFAFFGFCYICQFGPRRLVEFASGTDPDEHDHGEHHHF